MENISTLTELYRAFNIDYFDMIEDMLRFIRQTIADDQQLPSSHTEFGSLPVEQFTHLEIPVSDFQVADGFQIDRACCTGTKAFRKAILEKIGYGSRLEERQVMGICEGG